jgi:hypothetical protein
MDPKLLWDEYKLQVETYRFYLELVIKINLFFYAITGGILSFYFAGVNKEQVQLALVLPLVMSVLLFAFFLFGGISNKTSQKQVKLLATELGFKVYHATITLTYLLYGCSALMALVFVGLLTVLLSPCL